MNDRPTNAYIPPNLSDAGGIMGGMLKMRNLIEAGICIGIAVLVGKLVSIVVPSVITMVVFVVIGAIVALVAVVGVQGEPLSILFLNVINYRRVSGYCQIRMPMPMEVEEAKAKERKEEEMKGGEMSKFDSILINLLNGTKKKSKEK